MKTLLGACLLSTLAISQSAAAVEPPPGPDESAGARDADPSWRRHLCLYIRPDVGFGYMSMTAHPGGTHLERPAGTFGIAVGSAISENNLIAFHIWSSVIAKPSGMPGMTYGEFDKGFALTGFGFEYTAYSSQNFYVSISPSVTSLHLYNANSDANSNKDLNWGLGGRFAVGKEWWVADHWGVGLAAHFSGSVNYDAMNLNSWWSVWSATIAFSATYN